jgi:alkylhydroperoxidase family enzyme
MSDIAQARKALVARILEGDGRASHAYRRAAFDNARFAEPLRTLIDKVAKHAHTVTDDDIAAAKASGVSEDQIFEFVVCAAIGQATRQHDAALAALSAATGSEHAPRDPR